MTELLDEAAGTKVQVPASCGASKTALAQALEDADAAAAAATAAAAEALVRADQLRRQAQASAAGAPHADGEDDTTHEETARSSGDDLSAGGRRWLGSICIAVAVLLICATGAASGYMVWEHRAAVRDRQKTAEFTAAARQAVVTLMSMNFQNAKKDAQRVADDSTGQFRDDFTRNLNDLTALVEQSKVVTTAKVNGAAVQSISGDSATVLVAASSEVTNSAGAHQEPRAWRLVVTMTRDGGQLKMSRVEFIP